MVTGFTTIWGLSINPMVMVLGAILIALAFLLYLGQREGGENTFDFWDLLMDTLESGKRRASGIKVTYLTAFVVSTWVIVDQQIKGTLLPEIFMAYLGVWCASLIAKVVFDKKDMPALPARGGRE
jgi:hypothetical protein